VYRSPRQWLVYALIALAGSFSLPAEVSAGGASSRTVRKSSTSSKVTPNKKRVRVSSAQRSRARRARLARLRAEAARRQWLEAATPRYKLDEQGELVPDVRAAAAIIYDPLTGEVLWEENSQDKRSIASITKVMTAAVVLHESPDLSRRVTVDWRDVRRANHTYLRSRDRVTIDDLLHLALIASDNAAARALARTWPGGQAAFVKRMNERAQELGLESTTYTDPSGLDSGNVSSAYDMARLIAFAASDDRIADIMRKPSHRVNTGRRTISFNSTNQFVRGTNPHVEGTFDVRGAKTGFISKAGYCLASLLQLPSTGQQYAVVVLGASSSAVRFMETQHLFNWLTGRSSDAVTASAETPVAAAPAP
jgi:D-alanyl-D-alanine endopeptidase (penicillin-binding protein 7)